MSEGDSFTGSGVVRHACRHRVTARGLMRFKTAKFYGPLHSFAKMRLAGVESGYDGCCPPLRRHPAPPAIGRARLRRGRLRPGPRRHFGVFGDGKRVRFIGFPGARGADGVRQLVILSPGVQ